MQFKFKSKIGYFEAFNLSFDLASLPKYRPQSWASKINLPIGSFLKQDSSLVHLLVLHFM